MPISHAHRCIFIHIPKTGGTSIETQLGMFHSWEIENTDAAFGKIQSSTLINKGWATRYLQHLSWFELCDLVSPEKREGYFSFSYVRNPWERMVSIYSKKDPDMLEQAEQVGLKLAHLSFENFLDATLDFPHVHLRPQNEFILDRHCKPVIDFIGRFENIEADFLTICNKIGSQIRLVHVNKSTHGEYRRYYNDRTRALIAKKYLADAEAFGYFF
jgi:hypothetical protein